ncbi:MAG: hypothetical protein NVV74_23470 [Magnetospirillum sp.]|nr:hypothetical protein [Magnetospirillum sp.]
MWGRIWALVVKELLSVWRDRKSRFVLIVPPLIQMAVFSYAATYDVTDVTLALYNQDTGLASRELVARIQGSPTFARLQPVDSEAALAAAIDSATPWPPCASPRTSPAGSRPAFPPACRSCWMAGAPTPRRSPPATLPP